MKVRQSTVKDCYRAMQFDLEQPTYHGGSGRATGTAYHYGLELAYNLRIEEGFFVPGPELVGEWIELAVEKFDQTAALEPSHESELTKTPGSFKWNKAIPDRDSAIEALDRMLRSYFDPEEGGWWPENFTPLAVERGFSLPFFGDHTRNGSIDLILVDEHGYVIGDDQKTSGKGWNTGKEHPRKNPQANWYKTALESMYPDAPGHRFVFSIMTYKGKFERRISDPEPKHQAATDQLLADVVNMYIIAKGNGMDLPANPMSTLCSPEYCDWFSLCPHGEILER